MLQHDAIEYKCTYTCHVLNAIYTKELYASKETPQNASLISHATKDTSQCAPKIIMF